MFRLAFTLSPLLPLWSVLISAQGRQLDKAVDSPSILTSAAMGPTGPNQRPPILFVKTVKTGSSTLTNILHRLGDARNLTFMLPPDKAHLGWPGPFPGENFAAEPAHQYDIICNHAVYNASAMLAYLKEQPAPFRLTVLRQPLSRLVSAFHFFSDTPHELIRGSGLWAKRIKFLRELMHETDGTNGQLRAIYLNGQAHDLGFYELFKDRQHHSGKEVEKWIDGLGFDHVMLTERYNEGLVLLKRELGLEMQDVASLHFKDDAVDGDPNPTSGELAEIRELLGIDYALYAHFEDTFNKKWSSYGNLRELNELNGLNAHIAEICGGREEKECTWQLRADNVEYTKYLRHKQDEAGC